MIAQGHRDDVRRMVGVALATTVAGPLVLVAVASSADADQTYYVPVTKKWTIRGHGYGHGHGMSQHGAQGAALKGLGHRRIVKFYYPGTSWAKAKGAVRVLISSDVTSDLQVRARNGLKVQDLRDGARWRLPGHDSIRRWRIKSASDGSAIVQYLNGRGWHRWSPKGRRAFKGSAQFRASGPLTLYVPGANGLVAKRYRGILRSVRPYAGAENRDTVNVLSMDNYVKGVVPYEMPASWHRQALRSQAIAARTYATWQRSQNPRRYYQICDTTACQVYGGVAAEYNSTNAAVKDTAQQILTYNGKPAFTQFSASSGGWTSKGSVPYLPAKRDPYDDWSGNTVHDWSVNVSSSSLERLHPGIGRLVDVRVTSRDGNGAWNGRVNQIVLDGTDGKAYMSGDDFRWHFGLRSTWFTIEPTPIISRWRNLGGAKKSGMGRPVTGERAIASGSFQRFQIGQIYWKASIGAREIWGPSFKKYKKFGGPKSRLGFPTTGMRAAPDGGEKVVFQRGWIYRKRGIGAQVLYGAIGRAWLDRGGAGSWIGYPVSSVFKIDGGLRARFQHAVISWDRSSGKVTINRR